MRRYVTNILRMQIGSWLEHIAEHPEQRFRMKDVFGMLPSDDQEDLERQWRDAETAYDAISIKLNRCRVDYNQSPLLQNVQWYIEWTEKSASIEEEQTHKEILLAAADVLTRRWILRWTQQVPEQDKVYYEIQHTSEDLNNLVGLRDKRPRLRDISEYQLPKELQLHELILSALQKEHRRLLDREIRLRSP